MATTIKLKNGSGAPSAGNLVQGEPALDLTNKRLYTENSSGAVIEVGTNPTSLTTGAVTTTGNLLVGNTVTDPATSNVNGVAITAGGEVIASLNGVAAQFNRRTSDGDIAVFKKGGTTVGSIGVLSSRFYIGSGDTGIKFSGADDLISPIDASSGAGRDAAIDLGSSGARFKDLHLSGTVNAGGLDVDNLKIQSGLTASPTNDGANYIFRSSSAHADYSGGDLIIQARSSASRDIYMVTGSPTPVNRLQVKGDGNISFYEDTGTTAKFFWDASAESLGIGTSSLTAKLSLQTATGANNTSYNIIDATTDNPTYKAQINLVREDSSGKLGWAFLTNNVGSPTERMRIDSSGNLLVGKTTTAFGTAGTQLTSDGKINLTRTNTPLALNRLSSNGAIAQFYKDSSTVGSITVTSTSSSYNTSSDYRLKENVVPLTGAIDRVKQLKPSRFNFIADVDTTVDGFLAHEVADVVPEAITGTKDAMRDEEYEVTPAVYEDVVIPAVLDEEGNEVEAERTEQQLVTEAVMGTRSVPDYQGIDQSKLVPLLVATIQELEARITALESN